MKKNLVSKPCEICGKPIIGYPCRIKYRKYCSKKCYGMSEKGPKSIHYKICEVCGKIFTDYKSKIDARKVCSKECGLIIRRRRKIFICEYCDKELEITERDRRKRYCSNKCTAMARADKQRGTGKHPNSYPHYKGRKLHRYLAEKYFNKKLKTSDIVHHIDGNTKNNDPENLLITNRSEHIKIHKQDLHGAQ